MGKNTRNPSRDGHERSREEGYRIMRLLASSGSVSGEDAALQGVPEKVGLSA
jgi:hypothetical protein